MISFNSFKINFYYLVSFLNLSQLLFLYISGKIISLTIIYSKIILKEFPKLEVEPHKFKILSQQSTLQIMQLT